MDISKRLKAIVDLIEPCRAIVDVGTDHGYVPIYAVKKELVFNAIASDINKGPVEKAKLNVAFEGLKNDIECRLGPGLSTVKIGEVNGAIIAGMGGNLIRDIIVSHYKLFKALDFAILQPTQNPEVLREFLFNEEIYIEKEDLVIDEGIYYEIIKVYPKKVEKKNRELDSIYYEVSPYLIEDKHPLIEEYVENKINKNKDIISKITDNTEAAVKRKNFLEEKLKVLEALKNDYKN